MKTKLQIKSIYLEKQVYFSKLKRTIEMSLLTQKEMHQLTKDGYGYLFEIVPVESKKKRAKPDK